jgi:subtilisin family serine protease
MRFKFIFLFFVLQYLIVGVAAQNKKIALPPNWYNLDLMANGFFGISTEKAYAELLKDKTPKQKIIVAVMDGGTDINHEDLKDVLWVNEKEIPNNGIDDDGNGYIDDVHGWNFLGRKDKNLTYDNLELVRIIRKYDEKYKSVITTTILDSLEKVEYSLYRKAQADFGKKYDDASSAFPFYQTIKKLMDSVALIHHKDIPSLADLDQYKADDEMEEYVIKIIKKGIRDAGSIDKFYNEIKKGHHELDAMIKYNLNPTYDQRSELVGDDYDNSYQRNYGNSDVKGPNANHGSHVSGIVAANRSNAVGINGVANHARIMSIRIVPEGDERDKDVASGIHYAVDNGARIINMSFGKAYKWDKSVVDSAIKYAEKKGVLIVHAAGNDNKNIDTEENYPTKFFDSPEAIAYLKASKDKLLADLLNNAKSAKNAQINGQGQNRNMPNAVMRPILKPLDTLKFNLPHAKNWITVGASSYHLDGDLKASFSNYGKYTVDVFAPGFMINSTVPNSKYEEFDGTSMAAPVVSGLAALILSYYPKLTVLQIKEIILKSVVKVDRKVKYENERGETVHVPFADLCVSGGIVNAYNALKLAETY